jgi:hypothetical protein
MVSSDTYVIQTSWSCWKGQFYRRNWLVYFANLRYFTDTIRLCLSYK